MMVDGLRELLSIMRESRASHVKLADGTEVTLSPLAFAIPDATKPPAPVGLENGGEPTDEQLLMWSAGGELPKAQQPEVK